MSISAQRSFKLWVDCKKFQHSNLMHSKDIPSWKVQNGAHAEKQTDRHHFPIPWRMIVRDKKSCVLWSHSIWSLAVSIRRPAAFSTTHWYNPWSANSDCVINRFHVLICCKKTKGENGWPNSKRYTERSGRRKSRTRKDERGEWMA